MQRLRVLIAAGLLMAAVAVPAREDAAPEPVEPGRPFPAMSVQVLPPEAGETATVDLGRAVGKKPIVFCYIVLGEAMSEDVLLQLQDLAAGLDASPDIYGVIRPGRNATAQAAAARMSLLGFGHPLILDEEFRLGRVLGVGEAPSLSLVDGRGLLKISGARSLKQTVSTGFTMRRAIENAAEGGPVPVVTRLKRYYPANELVGEQFPDFILRQFQGTDRVRLSDRVGKEGKITALFFWHPNCKHCKRAMPGIVTGARTYEKWMDVVSVVNLEGPNEARNCEDTIRAHGMTFPVLEDEGRQVSDMYKIVSTPTMFFIKPDGVIDSVYMSGSINYLPVFASRIKQILDIGPDGRPQSR